MFILKMAEHSIESEHRQIVEIWNGNFFVGVIYPTEKGIKVISKYLLINPEQAIKIDKSPLAPAILICLVKQNVIK